MILLGNGKSSWYQWDVNQKVILTDIELDQINNQEVHFSSEVDSDENALVTEPYIDNGIIYAPVPNNLLMISGTIHIYIYVSNGDEAHTRLHKAVKVIAREKPSDYVYTETEVKSYEHLNERIDELERNGVSEQQIATAVEKYLDENPIDQGVNFTPGNALELTQDGVLNVLTTDEAVTDNTRPITSSGVYTIVGNIGAILDTI